MSVKPKLLISWRCGGAGHGQRSATLRVPSPLSQSVRHPHGKSQLNTLADKMTYRATYILTKAVSEILKNRLGFLPFRVVFILLNFPPRQE